VAGQIDTNQRLRIFFRRQLIIIRKMIKFMTENNQLETNGEESDSPNPAIIIGIFIAIGSFVLLTSTLNSIF